MIKPLTVESTIHFRRRGRGSRKTITLGASSETTQQPPGRVPRISRLMALAIRFDQLVRTGTVVDYAELARLGHVSRARITQVMNLLLLAPDIQEAILWLPRVEQGRDPLHLREIQPIAAIPDWRQQRSLWRELAGRPSLIDLQ